jgi:cation-transporting P-type ATPase E
VNVENAPLTEELPGRNAPRSDPRRGLTPADIEQRIRAGQVNDIPDAPTRTVAQILRANIFTPFNFLLGSLLVVILIVGPIQEALFGGVIIANSLMGIIQELRAKRTLDRLAVLSAPKAKAVRDGTVAEIGVGDVVLDDILVLAPGDQIVVDGDVVEEHGLEVDESLLTGESDPIAKDVGAAVLSGSFVAAGSGRYRATKVGHEAYAVQLAEEARKFTLVRSELRSGVDLIIKLVSWAMLPTAALLLYSQMRAHAGVYAAIRGTVAGVVAMVPEGLVLLTSVAFAVGVVRLARRNALVQELPAVETLARVDVVCLDKTGTITEGDIAVFGVETFGDRDVERALGALASADPNPNATLVAIGKAFSHPAAISARTTVPFSSARKWSGASFDGLGTWLLGAPEMLLARDAYAAIAARVEEHARAGQRVVLLASAAGALEDERLPTGVRPEALVLLEDTVRADAPETLRYFAEQGVRIKIISGDNAATVAAVARRAGVSGAGAGVDARTLPEDGAELGVALEENTVFGRVTPHQKRAMVKSLQDRGHVVAMTGDGVNDVLALKDADIGIAMGSGSSASRAVSQLVLLDGSFATLPAVVGEGRRVINNIERVANLFLTKTVYSMLLALAIGVAGLPFPFLPRHLTLVGSLTIGIPSFFLALAPNTHRAHSGFVTRVLRLAIPAGTLAAAGTFVGYYLVRNEEGVSLTEAQTTASIVLFSIGILVLARVARPLTAPRRLLVGACVVAFALVLITPGLRTFFAFDLPSTIILLACVGIFAIAAELMVLGHQVMVKIQQAGFLEYGDQEDEAVVVTDATKASAQSIASSNDSTRPSDQAPSKESSPI